ncbi:MAG: tetratricopeptide repeat protein, partial [Bdellovibrionales bacterium]|nr:tetratricopeptide repeat protein [Bdellovibrionales bacterium]
AVLAYQSLFFPRPSERGIKAQYSALYLGLFLVWPLLALLEHFGPHGSFAGFHHENVGSWVYLQTQFGVIVHYLGAALWPQRLSFDPGWKFTHNLSEVWWQMLVLVSLGVITLGAWMRGRPWAFLGLFFFLTLAPSSSVLPIADPAWNYRMYLPLWAVIATLAGAAPRGLLVYLSVALALPLGRITWQENKLYRSDLALWSATAERSPQNPRALNNFGIALERLGQIEAATAQYKAAHTLDAKYPGANLNLGRRAAKDKNFVEAIQYFRAALAADPTLAEAYNGIGAALFHSAHVAESIPNFQRALELGADDPAEVNFNLGTAYALTGNLNEAEGALRRALELHPGHAGAAGNLQNVLKLKDARRL